MYGLAAITAHNGWAMAFAGVVIVFSGLVVLSSTIAQFHKILTFFDNRMSHYQNDKTGAPTLDPVLAQKLAASARPFRRISDRMGEPFSLPKLLELSELSGLSRPHSTLNDLLTSGFIIPDGKGYFLWKQD